MNLIKNTHTAHRTTNNRAHFNGEREKNMRRHCENKQTHKHTHRENDVKEMYETEEEKKTN